MSLNLTPGVYAIACRCGDYCRCGHYLTIEEPGTQNPYMVHTIIDSVDLRRL